jgi:hypothetical protein
MADNDPTTPDEFECKVRAEFNYTRYPCAVDLAQPGPTPDQSKGLPVSTDLVTPVKAEVTNRLRESILATQYELGLKPSGTYGTVRARLDAMESLIAELFRRVRALEEGGGTGVGTIHVKDEGSTVLAHAKILNFIGDAVTVTAPNTVQADITITGGLVMIQVQETAPVSGGQTAFTLSYVPQDNDAVFMFVNGFKREAGTDYTVSAKNVTYAYGTLLATDIVEFWYIAEGSTVQQKQESFTAGAAQTDFFLTETPQDDTAIFMFVNGIKQQHGVDYTALEDHVSYAGAALLAGDVVEFWYIVNISGGTGGNVQVQDNGVSVLADAEILNFVGPEWIIGTTGSNTATIALSADGYERVQETLAVTSDGQTDFILGSVPLDDTAVEFFIEGIKQKYGTDYTVSGTALTYNDVDLLIGDVVDAVYQTDEVFGHLLYTKIQQAFTVTINGQTNFTLSQAPADSTKVEFFIEGVKQQYGTDYTVAGTVITYNDFDILIGDVVEAVYFVGSSATTYEPKLETLPAVFAGQEQFHLGQVPDDPSNVELFIEGIKQKYGTDYSVSNSTITYNDVDIIAGDVVDAVYITGDGTKPTWAQVLAWGNVSGGTDPIISDGDTLYGETNLILDTVKPDGYVIVQGKLTVTGLIDPTGLILDQQASVPGGDPANTKGTIWIRESDGYLVFTNRDGITTSLQSSGGGAGGNGSLAETLAIGDFTGGNDVVVSTGDKVVGESDLDLASAADGYIILQRGGSEVARWNEYNQLDVNANRIVDVQDPVDPQDVATKSYVDGYIGSNNEWSEILANGNTSEGTDVILNGGSALEIGATPATTGVIRLTNTEFIRSGTIGGTGTTVIGVDSGGRIQIGEFSEPWASHVIVHAGSGGMQVYCNDTTQSAIYADNYLSFSAPPGEDAVIRKGSPTSVGESGDLIIRGAVGYSAGDGYDGGDLILEGGDGSFLGSLNNGGDIIVKGGDGTNGGYDGYIIFRRGGSEVARWDNGGSERLLLGTQVVELPDLGGNDWDYIKTPDDAFMHLQISTGDSSSIPVGNIKVVSGSVSTGSSNSGDMWFASGTSATGRSGNIVVGSGVSSGNTSGNVSITTGNAYSTTGDLEIATGDITSSGNVGELSIYTGSNPSAGSAGDLNIFTGDSYLGSCGNIHIDGGDGYLNSGSVEITSGASPTGNAQGISLAAGDGLTLGGYISIEAGDADASQGGYVSVTAGNALDDSNGGPITITAGQSTSGPGGNITIVAGIGGLYDGYIILQRGATEVARWNEYNQLDVNGNRIVDVEDPIDPQDVATKSYVDGYCSGGGGGTLAETLALGNVTGGTDLIMSDGDVIQSASGPVTIDDDGYVTGDFTVAGKLTVDGLIDPTGLGFDPQASSPAPDSVLWMRQSDGYLMFTDALGADHNLIAGGGGPAAFNVITAELDGYVAVDGYVDDYDPTGLSDANVVRLDSDDSYDISGFVGNPSVVLKKIINVSAFDLVLLNEDTGSEEANRILVPSGQDLTLQPDDAVDVFYDVVDHRWRLT